jgi:hypothetical protein
VGECDLILEEGVEVLLDDLCVRPESLVVHAVVTHVPCGFQLFRLFVDLRLAFLVAVFPQFSFWLDRLLVLWLD